MWCTVAELICFHCSCTSLHQLRSYFHKSWIAHITIPVRGSTKKGIFHCSSCNSDLRSLFTLISQSKHLHCRDTAILNVEAIQYTYQLVQEFFGIALTIALLIIKFLFNRRGIKLVVKLWIDRPPVFETDE